MPPSIPHSPTGSPSLRKSPEIESSDERATNRATERSKSSVSTAASRSERRATAGSFHNSRTEEATDPNNDATLPQNTTSAANFSNSPLYGTSNSMMMNMMSPYNNYGSSMMYGGGMYGGGMYGPLTGLNQFLFGIQTMLFSLGQAVQIVGMNTQAFHQLLDAGTTMLDHAIVSWKDMRKLEQRSLENETEEDKKRRRRLRALRWCMIVGVCYTAYRFVRKVVQAHMRRKQFLLLGASNNSGAAIVPAAHHQHYPPMARGSPPSSYPPYYNDSYSYGNGTPHYGPPRGYPYGGGGAMNPYGGAGYY